MVFNGNCKTVYAAALFVLLGLSVSFAASEARAQPATPGGSEQPSFQPAGEQEFAPGRIIVKPKEGVRPARLGEVNRANGARVEDRIPGAAASVVDLPDDLPVRQAVQRYENTPGIEFAEPDFLLEATEVTPDDPGFSDMYGLENTGQEGGTEDADIGATEAWETTTGSKDTVVAVIDTGVDIDHPDLKNNIWTNEDEKDDGTDNDGNGYAGDVNGWDFYNDDNTVYDSGDGDEHGTHVAGTIAAEGDNGAGVTGVNWDARIMPLKFLGPDGGYTSDAAKAIDYAVDNGAEISNNSWGGGGYSQTLQDSLDNAEDKGHLFVAAAGNGGFDGIGDDNDANPSYPSSYENDNVVSVAATDRDDDRASFSNYGEESVDLGAPGVGILSTLPDSSYGRYNGTSMASPHVAGAAALLKSQDPAQGASELKNRMLDSAESVSSLKNRTATGGRLDAAGALAAEAKNSPANLSLSAGRSLLVYGQSTTLSGTLTSESGEAVAGEEISLEQRPIGGQVWSETARPTTDSNGEFRFDNARPGKRMLYRARFGGSDAKRLDPASSGGEWVSVKARVTNGTSEKNLKLGNRREIYGSVLPSHAGSSVEMILKRNGEIVARRMVSVNEDSRYRTLVQPGSPGSYATFAIFPRDDDHLGNRSVARSFQVVR